MNSKKGLSTIIIVIIVLVLLASAGIRANNNMVTMEENVSTAWSQVENQYQRRMDLIPNLVSTVKGYAEHESTTLQEVVEARSKASAATIDPNNLTPEAMQNFMNAQGELTQALGRLMVTVERYPDLKANENFLALQSQLEGTENRISTERMRFNEVAREYNTYIRKFPNNLFAGILGFDQKSYFESTPGAERAPEVQF